MYSMDKVRQMLCMLLMFCVEVQFVYWFGSLHLIIKVFLYKEYIFDGVSMEQAGAHSRHNGNRGSQSFSGPI